MRGTSLIAILTLAIGVGFTTTVFSIVYAALLRPLPFDAPDRLVMLYTTRTSAREGTQRLRWAHAELTSLDQRLSSLDALASFTQTRVNLTGGGDPEQIFGEIISPAYPDLLHVAPVRGRSFLPEEDSTEEGHPVALISARLWRVRFGSDPSILGRTVGINEVPLMIVGILPESFSGLSGRADIWIPTTMAPRLTYRDYLTTPQHFINFVGRLKPGVPVAQASAELAALAPHIVVPEAATGSEPVTWSATVRPLADARIDPSVRRSGLLLIGAVACVLTISCVNVASVLLARARTRRREIAMRLALGSTRFRIVRQLLTESLVLAAIGGIFGTLLAAWGVAAISLPSVIASSRNDYGQLSGFATPAVDGAVLLFAVVITIGTNILFGLTPALETSQPDLVGALKEDSRTAAGGGQLRVLAGLVITEIAVAVVLLTGAGLLLKTFARLQELRVGFVPQGVLTFSVNPPSSRYLPADGPAIIERLLSSVERVPGVIAATVNRCTPFTNCARTVVFFPEHPTDAAHAPAVGRHYVSASYFRTLGIPVLAGRALTDQDRAGRPPVAVINETAARRFWPGESPIGRHVWFGGGTGFTDPNRPVEIVGVAGDVKYGSRDEATGPDFYTSYLQFAYPDTLILVKSDRAMTALVPSLRRAVAAADAALPIYDVQTVDDRIAEALARPRFNAIVLILFAVTAVVLAAVGVYGVMAYTVSFRLHEIGIRLALGANSRSVLGLVLGEGLRLATAGAAIGVGAALAFSHALRSVLFDVSPTDPVILSVGALAIVAVGVAAAFVPAWRASSVDPMIVLRGE
jgi:predicted permease